jgi:hypothetical protein
MKYIVTVDNDDVAIGPFKSLEEATAYRDTDMDREHMRVCEVLEPVAGWKRTALTNWPKGVNRREGNAGANKND